MRVALVTNYLTGYRLPLYERLADRCGVEVLCYGGGAHYLPSWYLDLDRQLEAAPFPARRIAGARSLLELGRGYDAVIAGVAGGAMLPLAFAGAKLHRRGFVLWASVWAQPRSWKHAVALPATRAIYRHADAVVSYGPHASAFIAPFRRNPEEILVAPQSVEPELFGRAVSDAEIARFRSEHELGEDPLVVYTGRLVPEKGVGVLLDAWAARRREARLLVAGDGPMADEVRAAPGVTFLGALDRAALPVLYAASEFAVMPSYPTPLFREPWGLVANEAMHQRRPVIATRTVGAAAGGLVRDGETGLVIAPRDPAALSDAIDRLLGDAPLRERLGAAAQAAVAGYTYDAMADAFATAIARAVS